MDEELLKAIKAIEEHLHNASLELSTLTKKHYLKLGKEKTEMLTKIKTGINEARSYLKRRT